MVKKRQHSYKIATGLILLWLAATALSTPATELLEGNSYTWGIRTPARLALEPGQIITEAVLTIHNVEAVRNDDPRPPCPTDKIHIYLLDNPRYGFWRLETTFSDSNPFASLGNALTAKYENGNLICRLNKPDDRDSWASRIFGEQLPLTLADGTDSPMFPTLLEFIDYAATGVSAGFGIHLGTLRYRYENITLTLTVQSYEGDRPAETLVFQVVHTLEVAAVNGSVEITPDLARYIDGATVTLKAVPDRGYLFNGWTGCIQRSDNPITIVMDGNKSTTARFR